MRLIVDPRTSKYVAKLLLEVGAVKINLDTPYTWSAGWKTPIYCDCRLMLSEPKRRAEIIRHFRIVIESIRNKTEHSIYGVAGVVTAGVPWASFVAHDMSIPLLYIRPQPKPHGTGKQVEGINDPDVCYAVIEDLISTSKSSVDSTIIARNEGVNVGVVGAVVTYGFPQADNAFEEAGIDYFSLTDYRTIIGLCDWLTDDQRNTLNDWSNNPSKWSVDHGGKP